MKNLRQVINESEKSNLKKEYQDFFDKKLEKFGVSSPSELSEEEKKKFFDEIQKEWKEGSGEVKESKDEKEVEEEVEVEVEIKDEEEDEDEEEKGEDIKEDGETAKEENEKNEEEKENEEEGIVKEHHIEKIVKDALPDDVEVTSTYEGEYEIAKFSNLSEEELSSLVEMIKEAGKEAELDGDSIKMKIEESDNVDEAHTEYKIGNYAAKKLRAIKSKEGFAYLEGFADKVENMSKVSKEDLEELLPDWVPGKDIESVFK